MRRYVLLSMAVLLALGGVLAIAGALWVRAELRASLPQIEGSLRLPGLAAPVEVARDGLGIPAIRGASREDVARATGFVHAQDRFFQMDLSRRRAAGELAELVGAQALALDRDVRRHRFRAVARRALALLGERDRAALDAYTDGVNAGVAALAAAPMEYLLLRQAPRAWHAEDSLLVVLSMFVTLQDGSGSYESTLSTMHDVLPREMFDLLAPLGTEWDSPVLGSAFSTPPIPGPDVYDLRARRGNGPEVDLLAGSQDARRQLQSFECQGPWPLRRIWVCGEASQSGWEPSEAGDTAVGSNSWAIAGRLAADGGALVANDIHLPIRVPNIWYRALMEWPDPSGASRPRQLTGLTLPGVPALVVGSNTDVAWGFTNTYADWSDIVLLELHPDDPDQYRTPSGWRAFDRHEETFRVAGQDDRRDTVVWTIWGPVIGPDHRGRARAYRWVAHDADRLAASILPLESARTVDEALEEVNGLGIPGQNFVVADRDGRIGWSVYGALPRRAGLDGRLPASWADGSRGWMGWLEPSEYPRIVDPEDGRIWTANARVVDGDMLVKLGDGSYDVGARAGTIRERLMARERFAPVDLLAIQLDTDAGFLARWRDLIIRTLTPSVVHGHPGRAAFRDILEHEWSGQVSAGSSAYRLTSLFREYVSDRVIAFVLAECFEADALFDYQTVRGREGPIWKLVTEQPLHLLDPRYEHWGDLFLRAVDAVIEQTAGGEGRALAQRAWTDDNVRPFQHPLSAALPFLGRWLDMPLEPLPGDRYTVRVHRGTVGASARMVVSPGREEEGIMHMPTGQSGHPLSAFYANSHRAWLDGTPTAYLPGPPGHLLTLLP